MIGKQILHYKITEKLGEGGMGVVYKAEDTKLKRDVAIKFLPLQIAASEEYRERFKIEAQAAAALNHPNIATIHAIEEIDDEMFIVMEHIEGQELRKIVKTHNHASLPVDEIIDYASQIAAGLQAAHENGITHRDIKSTNIMVTKSGQIKIMDFGLAKIGGGAQLTKDHSTLGTAAYMSPEQARGEAVDHRTDIWAFGVVFYEILTGKLPFSGDYEQAVIYSILNEEPDFTNIPDAPAGVAQKALVKQADARYQNAHEMLADLKTLQASELPATLSGVKEKGAPWKNLTMSLGIAAIFVLIAVALWQGILVGQKDPRPFQNMQISRLTNTGKAGFANISPDGNYVVHALHGQGKSSLWVRQVATSSNVRIVPPADVVFSGATFSRDGNYIFYVMSNKVSLVSTLYRVPTLGGASKKILSNIAGSVTLSPDGQQIAFVRQFSSQGEEALMLANVDGSAVRKLASRKEPEFFVGDDHVGPSWSPDGKYLACGAGSVAGEWRMGVLLVSIEDGTQAWLLQPKRRFNTNRMVWTPDGKGLVVNAIDTTSQSRDQLWRVSYPEGELHRVTNDLNSYEPASLGLTADGRTLVTVKVERTSNIWTIPDLDASRAVQLSFTAGTDEGTQGVSCAADGRIVYSSVESGNFDIWVMDQDGGNKRQLTTDPAPDRWPSVTRDGGSLVFHSDRTSIPHIWKMDLASGELVQLTGREDYSPVCTWDGKWIVYWGYRPGQLGLSGAAYTVQKIAIDGGPPVQLTEKIARNPAASPDGKTVACRYQDAPGGPFLLAILPFEGGQPLKLFEIPPSVEWLAWTADGSAVMYLDSRTGVSNIWSQTVAGGPPERLTDFKSGVIFNFAISRDGGTLVCARGSVSSDVVLIEDVK